MGPKAIFVRGAVVRMSEEDIRRLVATGFERGWLKAGDSRWMAEEVRRMELDDHNRRNRESRARLRAGTNTTAR